MVGIPTLSQEPMPYTMGCSIWEMSSKTSSSSQSPATTAEDFILSALHFQSNTSTYMRVKPYKHDIAKYIIHIGTPCIYCTTQPTLKSPKHLDKISRQPSSPTQYTILTDYLQN